MPINKYINIRKALVEIANLFAVSARRMASSSNVPGVPNAIVVNSPVTTANKTSITVEVDPGKMKNKEGRSIPGAEWAYEFGSGLYGPKRKKYLIEPKKASVLAFPGGKSFFLQRQGQSLLPMGAEGTVFLPQVEHPGVGARPFFSTTLSQNIKKYMEIYSKHLDLNKVFAEFAEVWVD